MAIWKSIKGFNGKYWVSDEGQIISMDYNHSGKVKLLKPCFGNGYLGIMLSINGKRKRYLIHRLVAEAFLPNPDNLPCVNHKNERKTENRAENLEWCSYKYNINYGTASQRISNTLKGHFVSNETKQKISKALKGKPCSPIVIKKLSNPIIQYDLEGNFIREWASSREIERELNFAHTNINNCCKGKYKTFYGYKWEYKERAA